MNVSLSIFSVQRLVNFISAKEIINIPQDESLHSFLIREQLIYSDKFDPKGVITADGMWRSQPYAHSSVVSLFEKYQEEFLFNLLNTNTDFYLGSNPIYSPTLFINKLHSVFFAGEHVKSKSKIEIKFCVSCIEAAIRKYGYGYFKNEWSNSSFCRIHNNYLMYLPATSYKQAIDNLILVISGRIPYISKIEKKATKFRFFDSAIKRKNDDYYVFPIKVMLCTLDDIGFWMIKNLSTELGFINVFDFPEQLIETIEALLHIYRGNKELNEYIYKKMEFWKIKISAKGELTEIVMVPKHKECSSCMHQNICDLQNLESDYISDNLNLYFLSQHSLTLRKYISNQTGFLGVMRYPWQPLLISETNNQ